MKNKIIRSESIAESNFKFKFYIYSTDIKGENLHAALPAN